MIHCRTILIPTLLFQLAIATPMTAWAENRCTDAKRIAATIPVNAGSEEAKEAEKQILDYCPDGAAGYFIQGLRAEREARHDDAIRNYREALRLDPAFPRAQGNLGLALLEKGSYDDAVVELTRAISSDPNPRYHQGLAEVFGKRKLYSLALYHYGEAANGLPSDPVIPTELASLYQDMGKKEDAEKQYRKALRLSPANESARLGLASLYMGEGETNRAIAELKQAQIANPGNKEINLLLAEAYEKMGDHQAADYESLLAGKQRGVLSDERLRRGDELMQAKEYAKAVEEFKAALKEKPEWPAALEKLVDAQTAAGLDDEAIASYKELLRLRIGGGDTHYNLGVVYERKGLIDEAVVEYKQAIHDSPDNGDARRRLADIYALRGSYPQAIEQYKELLKKGDSNPLLHLKLARAYLSAKNPQDAFASYKEAIRIAPDNLEARRELATLYRKSNLTNEAEQQYREILRIKKNDADARNVLTAIYVKTKKYDELITLLQEGVELAPNDPASHYKLGLIYEFKKDYDAAEAQYKKAIELKGDHAKSLNALGRIYLKMGKINEAKEVLEAAKKADPGMEETAVLLSNIKEELSPDTPRYSKKHRSAKASKWTSKKSKKKFAKNNSKKSSKKKVVTKSKTTQKAKKAQKNKKKN